MISSSFTPIFSSSLLDFCLHFPPYSFRCANLLFKFPIANISTSLLFAWQNSKSEWEQLSLLFMPLGETVQIQSWVKGLHYVFIIIKLKCLPSRNSISFFKPTFSPTIHNNYIISFPLFLDIWCRLYPHVLNLQETSKKGN